MEERALEIEDLYDLNLKFVDQHARSTRGEVVTSRRDARGVDVSRKVVLVYLKIRIGTDDHVDGTVETSPDGTQLIYHGDAKGVEGMKGLVEFYQDQYQSRLARGYDPHLFPDNSLAGLLLYMCTRLQGRTWAGIEDAEGLPPEIAEFVKKP